MREKSPATTARYDISDVIVEVDCDDERAASHVADYLSSHVCPKDAAPDIRFAMYRRGGPDLSVPEGAHWFFNYNGIAGFSHRGLCYYTVMDSVFYFDPDALEITGRLTDPLIESGRVFTHGVFMILLLEALRYRGLFSVHGAALGSPGGKSLVVTGESCSGKTTMAMGLILNGWKWLTDDTFFFRNGPGELNMVPLQRPFHLPQRIIELVPEFHYLLDAPEYFPGVSKRALDCERHYAGARVSSLKAPDVILFSRIVNGPESRVVEMNALDGLNELIRHSLFLMFSKPPAKAHLDTLKKAVQGARCHRLSAGTDMRDDPKEASMKILQQIPGLV